MDIDRILRYAKDTSFCCGCVDYEMSNEQYDACKNCEHRYFFSEVIKLCELRQKKQVNQNTDDIACPNCNNNIPTLIKYWNMPYCSFCGQRLYWG